MISEKNMLSKYMGESLSMTRHTCLLSPNKDMGDVAIENFDFMLDALAKKL